MKGTRRGNPRKSPLDPDRGLLAFIKRSPRCGHCALSLTTPRIQFMRGRFAGLIVSAVLSTLSIILFFYPGLNLGVDFRGGILVELRGPQALQTGAIRDAFAPLDFGDLRVQEFGSPQDVLVRFENKKQIQDAQQKIAAQVARALPDVQVRRVRSGRRHGQRRAVSQRAAGDRARPGRGADLHLVSVRVAVRRGRRRHPDPRRHQDRRPFSGSLSSSSISPRSQPC